MKAILETLTFLFGTAFVLGFVTYGLKNLLNTPPSATPNAPNPTPVTVPPETPTVVTEVVAESTSSSPL